MKFTILFLILLVAACGKYGPMTGDADRVGYVLPVIKEVDPTDLSNINQICSSILAKEARLDNLVNIDQLYKVTKKDCSATEQVEEGVVVAIQKDGTNYTLKTSNINFIFPNVETLNSNGVLASICSALPTLATNPEINVGANLLQVTTLGIANDFCSPTGEEICLRVLYANPGDRTVHTKEWLKVIARPLITNDAKRGLVTDRRKVTRGFCAQDEVVIHRATLQ